MYNFGWISVDQRLPKFNDIVLAYDSQRIYIAKRVKEGEYNEHWKVYEEKTPICDQCFEGMAEQENEEEI
jgi:hypothetical protein